MYSTARIVVVVLYECSADGVIASVGDHDGRSRMIVLTKDGVRACYVLEFRDGVRVSFCPRAFDANPFFQSSSFIQLRSEVP
jgi:hypothetical protein